MFLRTVASVALIALSAPVFAADAPAPLPKNMEGQWGNGGKKAEAELIKMESPTTAKLNATFWDGCTRSGETTAEFKDGAWVFVVPGGMRCENISVKMKPVEGKSRYEGTIDTVNKGPVSGPMFLEGK